MLQLKGQTYQVASAELNLRQRMYQKESIVSIQAQIAFYPRQVEDHIVSGAMEIVVDTPLRSLDDLTKQVYQGKIGKIVVSWNMDGVWKSETYYEFQVSFQKRKQNRIELQVEESSKQIVAALPLTIVSLYTTSSSEAELKNLFEMEDFYDLPIRNTIRDRVILKYIVKGE